MLVEIMKIEMFIESLLTVKAGAGASDAGKVV
jgi:hypothetical protein